MEEKERYEWDKIEESCEWIRDTEMGNQPLYYDLKTVAHLLNQQDKRIAELEEQLKNCIKPKFRTYQSIFYITQFYTSTKGNPEYDIISDKYYVAENDIVLDPFMGIGSCGLACKELNRKFIGIELDPNYFEIAKKRIGE